jgi:hypothetical protein
MEQNNVLTKLLAEVSKVHLQEKQRRLDMEKRGEYFNVFDVLKLSRNEVRFHSAFIAELLNPSGSHGLGDKFLKAFIEIIFGNRDQKFSGNDFMKVFDTKSATVEVEHDIGLISENEEEGGRIDIFLEDANNHAIIIENKIDACDQHNQLIRYGNYAEKFDKYELLYLTKNGSAASEGSAGKDAKDYTPISYRHDILEWLKECIRISAMIPSVRETIYQYIINLKEILDIMDEENMNKIVNVATDEKYLDATLDIFNNWGPIMAKLRSNFIQELKKEAQKCGLSVDDKYEEGLEKVTLQPDAYIYFMPNNLKDDKWAFCIGYDKSKKLCYGISTHDCNDEKNIICEQVYDEKPELYWPLGWSRIYGLDDLSNWRENESKIMQTLVSEFMRTEELIKKVKKEEEKKCL